MKLNKYILVIDINKDSFLLYNSINGGILQLNKYNLNKDEIVDLDSGNREYLDNNLFLDTPETREQINRLIELGYTSDISVLNLTIEVNRKCNLKCRYCYQMGTFHSDEISFETIDSIIKYIQHVCKLKNKKELVINLIGGEPLLSCDKILYIYDRVCKLAKTFDMDYKFIINTNGTLLSEKVFYEIENATYSITFSLPGDHMLNRPGKGFNSYETILHNLIDMKTKLPDTSDFSIRYNVNDKNIDDFERFLILLDENSIKPNEISTMYTDEYENTKFKNGLDKKKFLEWNSSRAIDLMVDYGYKIYYSPKCMFTPCKAYFNDNYKFFCNGSIGLCDASDYDANTINIKECNFNELGSFFSNIKSWNPLHDYECSECKDLALCGGKYFCRQLCNFSNRYDVIIFLKTFYKYVKLGMENFFPNVIK